MREASRGLGREQLGAWSSYTDCSSSGGSKSSPTLPRTAWRFTGHLTGRSFRPPPLTGSKLQGALGRSVRWWIKRSISTRSKKGLLLSLRNTNYLSEWWSVVVSIVGIKIPTRATRPPVPKQNSLKKCSRDQKPDMDCKVLAVWYWMSKQSNFTRPQLSPPLPSHSFAPLPAHAFSFLSLQQGLMWVRLASNLLSYCEAEADLEFLIFLFYLLRHTDITTQLPPSCGSARWLGK